MQLAVSQAWEIGLFQVPFSLGNALCWVFWAFFALGWLIQWLALKKVRRGGLVFPALLALGLLAGEIGCQTVTGWDLLLPLVGWWLCLNMLLGAAAGWGWTRRKTNP